MSTGSVAPSFGMLAESAPLFAALGDETRLGLVVRLCRDGPASITQLTSGGAVTRQAVTKHLQVLENTGVVRGVRQGREHVWQIEPLRLDEAKLYLEVILQQWDVALDKLRAAVEEA